MNLFAYGSLIEPDTQREVFGCIRHGEVDWVEGYGIESITCEGVQYARAFPKEGSELRGLRMEVTEAELRNIDLYEGADYVRKVVILKSGSCAWLYQRPDVVPERG